MKVLFVCTGNICRSVMAERIFEHAAPEFEYVSAGISDEELRKPIDPRAVQLLMHRGYRTDGHAAQKVTAEQVKEADLIVAMTSEHSKVVKKLAKEAGLKKKDRNEKIRLYREFASTPPDDGNLDLNDPWYGDMEDFIETLGYLEDGVEGVLDHLEKLGRTRKNGS